MLGPEEALAQQCIGAIWLAGGTALRRPCAPATGPDPCVSCGCRSPSAGMTLTGRLGSGYLAQGSGRQPRGAIAWYDCINTSVRFGRTGVSMARSEADELRREPEPRATFLDLFFDLVFVFAIFRLSQGLLEHLNGTGDLQTLVLVFAVWFAWTQTAAVTDRFDPQRPAIQLMVIGCMFGSFVLAAAVPGAFGARGLLFASAY